MVRYESLIFAFEAMILVEQDQVQITHSSQHYSFSEDGLLKSHQQVILQPL